MSVLFDNRWTPEMAETGSEKRTREFLSSERVAQRVMQAIERAWVFAAFNDLPNDKYVVKDVRVLEWKEKKKEKVQVLILEGWRTPARIWTDEPEMEILETVQ